MFIYTVKDVFGLVVLAVLAVLAAVTLSVLIYAGLAALQRWFRGRGRKR